MELLEEPNKEFVEFFMLHHSQNQHCFKGLDGEDKAGQNILMLLSNM